MAIKQKPADKQQELKNIVKEFSNLIFDYSEIRNNFHNAVSTEDEARDEIAWKHFKGKGISVPDLPNERYSAFKSAIPKEEINKVIDESRKGKELWDGLENRLSEIRQRLKAPAFKLIPEIFTSEYCPAGIENHANMLCFISEIENEFKKEKYYLINTSTCEAAFKNFLLNKLKDMRDRGIERHGKEIQELSPAEAVKGNGGETPETIAQTRGYAWEFNKEKREVSCNGSKPVKLEPRLFNIWHYLYTHTGERITPKTLLDNGWQHTTRESHPNYKRDIQDSVNKLRNKLTGLGLSKDVLDLIIKDNKKGKKIVSWTFNREITLF